MNQKNWVRAFVLAAIIAWPGYEIYQYQVAKHQLAASQELQESIGNKLATARVKYAQAKVAEQTTVEQ